MAEGPAAISVDEVEANGLRFKCQSCGDGSAGSVLFLHGFPEWSDIYIPMMQRISAKGFKCVAFDQRGYSQGARPLERKDYHYDRLVEDLFAVADAMGFAKFHVVAHDHGAVLGWYALSGVRAKERFLTYAAISVPHNDALSVGLYGDAADLGQQRASQYFHKFVAEGSAPGIFEAWGGEKLGFSTAEELQRALWWYYNLVEPGVMALPPKVEAGPGEGEFQLVPDTGLRQKCKVGFVDIPVVFAASVGDEALLNTLPFAKATSDFCRGGYKYAEAQCGHWITPPCPENQVWYDAIEALVCGTLEFDIPPSAPA